MTNSECVESTWRHQLPSNTSCYQVEDGSFFLFNEVAPYALCAVIKGKRIDVALPALKETLYCSGVHEKTLYFYSTPPRRRSYNFYRASIDNERVEFSKIREVQNGVEPLYFANCQPFYVSEINGQKQIFDFDSDQGSKVAKYNAGEIFFQHLKILYRLHKGISVAVTQDKYYSSYTVLVTVPDPSKAAVYSRGDSEVLYVIAGNELLVIINHTLAKTFRLQSPPNKSIDFSSSLAIVGVHSAQIVFCALELSNKVRNLWSAELNEQHCDRSAHCNLRPHFPTFIPSNNIAAKRTENLSNLSVIFSPSVESASTVSRYRRLNGLTNTVSSTANQIMPTKPTSRVLPNSTKTIPLSAGIGSLQLSNGVSATFESDFFKNFKPLKVLGQGQFGCVFEVERNLEGVTWKRAVKRIALRGSLKQVNDALKEVDAMAKFDHPGIVRFYDAWKEQPPINWQRESDSILFNKLDYKEFVEYPNDCSFIFIQMELCKSTLSHWLTGNKVRNLQKIKIWFRQIVSAVGYIHREGKIHRDLKPNNILITSDNVLKICDLGLIADCQIESGLEKSRTRTSAGTLMYMAPEQFGMKYTSKVDVFALGLILTQLCAVLTIDKAIEVFGNYRAGKPNTVLDKHPQVKSLVEWLTKTAHSERPTCDEILRDSFLF